MIKINKMELTEKQTEAMEAIRSGLFSFILYGGAIRGGKTVWGLSALLVLCQLFPKSRWCVIREDMEKIRRLWMCLTKLKHLSKMQHL